MLITCIALYCKCLLLDEYVNIPKHPGIDKQISLTICYMFWPYWMLSSCTFMKLYVHFIKKCIIFVNFVFFIHFFLADMKTINPIHSLIILFLCNYPSAPFHTHFRMYPHLFSPLPWLAWLLFLVDLQCDQCDRAAECIYDVERLMYRCQCRPGYTGDGRTCSRIGEGSVHHAPLWIVVK